MAGFSTSRLKSEEKCCKKCGRLFMYYGVGHLYCPVCAKADNKTFNKVKEYLYEHGASSLKEVALATDVSEKKIMTYLREGRLEIPEGSDIFIRCESCGVEMRSGRYCPECANKLIHKLSGRGSAHLVNDEIGEVTKKNQSARMRFLDGHSNFKK